MTLRGKVPDRQQKRLKALFFGEAGSGKTTCALGFPRVYLIDTEKGAVNDQYVRLLEQGGGVSFQSTSWPEIHNEIVALLSTAHNYQTLVIDPITPLYDDALDHAEAKVGSQHGRHYGVVKKDWKRLARLLSRLDMNVLVTAHQKRLYGEKLEVVAQTYDGPRGLDYLFDLVIEAQHRPAARVGLVRKSRLAGFSEGEEIPFTYAEVARRYGAELLERQAVPVELATAKQCAELRAMLAAHRDGEDLERRILQRAEADAFEEMRAADAVACIDWLRYRLRRAGT